MSKKAFEGIIVIPAAACRLQYARPFHKKRTACREAPGSLDSTPERRPFGTVAVRSASFARPLASSGESQEA